MSVWQFTSKNLLAWTAAFAMMEPVSYFVIPALSRSKTVAEYYDPSRTSVAMVTFGDYIYSTFLYMAALTIIPIIWTRTPPTFIIGFAVFLIIQWIGDFSWYGLLQVWPERWSGKYIDFFRRYTNDVSVSAPIGDSLYGLAWFTLTWLCMTYVPPSLQIGAISLFMFGCLVLSV